MGRHRAENEPDKKSTSEKVQGPRNDASQSKHRATGQTTQDLNQPAGSDLPHRDENL